MVSRSYKPLVLAFVILFSLLLILPEVSAATLKADILRPNAAGGSTQWVRNTGVGTANWQAVDEDVSDSDTTAVTSATNNVIDSYNLNMTTTFTYAYIYHLDACARVKYVASGADFRHIVTTNQSANATSAADIAATSAYVKYCTRFNARPGAGDWTSADLPLLEAGVKQTSAKNQSVTQVWILYNYTTANVSFNESFPTFGTTGVYAGGSSQFREVKFLCGDAPCFAPNLTLAQNRTSNGSSFITGNTTNINTFLNTNQTNRVGFTCSPPGGTTPGIYEAVFVGNATDDAGGTIVNVSCKVISGTVSWNESTATANSMWGGGNVTREVKVTSNSGQNTNVQVAQNGAGNGTAIIEKNVSSIGTLAVTKTIDVSFYCIPTISQAPGIYEQNFKVSSTEDSTGGTVLVKCPVMPSNLTFNETDPASPGYTVISTADAQQGTTHYREIQVWSNGTNNQTNITDAQAGAGNGSSFITKNATNLGNLINASTYDVKFTCAPLIAQNLGIYDYNVTINSTQNGSAVNLTVKCKVTSAQDITITMVVDMVNFGDMLAGTSDNTDDASPGPLVIRNDGNVNVDIKIKATDLFTSAGFGNPIDNYQWNSTPYELGSLANNVMDVNLFGYRDMPVSTDDTVYFIRELKPETSSTDEAAINLNITIPAEEVPWTRSSTITFTASAS